MTHQSVLELSRHGSSQYGPKRLLAQLFEVGQAHLAEGGITTRLASFEELEAVNALNADSWRPLFPSFRARAAGKNRDNGFAILAIDREGDVVAAQGVRVFDWRETNLKAEAESLRLFHADPVSDRGPTEECCVTIPGAELVSGRVAFNGAVWWRPDYRKTGFARILSRIVRAHSLANYDLDHLFAIFTPENISRGIHTKSGYGAAAEAMVFRNAHTLPGEVVEMAVCVISPMDAVDDIFSLLQKLDRGVHDGRTQHTSLSA